MPRSSDATDSSTERKQPASHTFTLDQGQLETVRAHCEVRGWAPFLPEHALWAFRNDVLKVVVTAYKSGKCVVAGKGAFDWIRDFVEPEVTGVARLGYDELHHPDWFELHAGMDEAGKGDVFGPLVVATVVADGDAVRAWIAAGVRDSKDLADSSILALDRRIRGTPGVTVRTGKCSMARYNELMAKPRANLNLLLAWLHARTLEDALRERRAPWGLLDQFSKQPLVQRYFKDPAFDLRMRTKAESDPVVAAASIVARAEFVREMDALSRAAALGEPLAKGASAKVKAQGKLLLDKFGAERLGEFIKMHFRTAYEIQGLPVPEKESSRFFRRKGS